jgi:aryl-alcohol dehydrogenase-like predicted oxidoreductase
MSTIKRALLGSQGLQVSVEGLGCMGMTGSYGEADEQESMATLHRALELGVDMLDTADLYGPLTNERLLAKFLVGQRDKVTLATKFGSALMPVSSMAGAAYPEGM